MNINNIFSPARTGWLMRKYIKENRSPLLFVTAFMFLISIINGLSYMYSEDKGVDDEIGFMLIAFSMCGCLMASIAFRSMWNMKSAVTVLMTPVSAFEQCMVRWIVVVPVYILWAFVSAVFADVFKYLMANYLFGGSIEMIPWGRIFDFSSSEAFFNLYIVFVLFIFTQSFYFLGSVVWRKHNFIKTFFVMGLLFMLYVIPVSIIVDLYSSSNYVIFGGRDFLKYFPYQILLWLGTIVNYTLTVMRFKEAEIIHRW